jgi:rRNA processing protein Krr1/Pno1
MILIDIGSALKEIVVAAGGSDENRELARTVQFPKADADGNLIKIQGKAAVVDKIIARMEAIVAERESQTTETFDVPTDQHRKLIGRGGDIKKGLESKFKVSIDVPRQNSGQTGVKISGLPADVEKAKTHILGLVKEEAEGETVQVPRGVHHGVSNNGAFFKKLRHDHQVTVDHGGHKVPPKPEAAPARANGDALPLITDDAADAHSWRVAGLSTSDIDGEIPWILRGPPDNLAKAREALLAAIEEAKKNDTVGYLRLPDPHTYRYVIGQGGNKVNSIRKAAGCKITVPRDQASDAAIEIIGTAEGVEKTKELILQAVKEGISNTNGGGRANGNGNGNWD